MGEVEHRDWTERNVRKQVCDPSSELFDILRSETKSLEVMNTVTTAKRDVRNKLPACTGCTFDAHGQGSSSDCKRVEWTLLYNSHIDLFNEARTQYRRMSSYLSG